jgi:hypothetical protein
VNAAFHGQVIPFIMCRVLPRRSADSLARSLAKSNFGLAQCALSETGTFCVMTRETGLVKLRLSNSDALTTRVWHS